MASSKAYSAAEISLHASKKDCWLSIHGKVYDVTAFMEEHPGGEEAILNAAAAGGDASEAFDEVGHSSTATSMLQSYLIGAVEGHASGPSKPFFGPMLSQSQQGKPAEASPAGPLLLPLLALGLAFAAWYYYNFYAKVSS
ncbi:uncharacterized protein LOC141842360 [Curcuma longa]|uniref:uncharacterized protein LOC141842360 n=1 Tax=Curcuma longa TaxID=136217 RepID=UPI003D9E4E62